MGHTAAIVAFLWQPGCGHTPRRCAAHAAAGLPGILPALGRRGPGAARRIGRGRDDDGAWTVGWTIGGGLGLRPAGARGGSLRFQRPRQNHLLRCFGAAADVHLLRRNLVQPIACADAPRALRRRRVGLSGCWPRHRAAGDPREPNPQRHRQWSSAQDLLQRPHGAPKADLLHCGPSHPAGVRCRHRLRRRPAARPDLCLRPGSHSARSSARSFPSENAGCGLQRAVEASDICEPRRAGGAARGALRGHRAS
mmetsp:Transcript_11713/g.41826  ORF Transcript_11713/g.41826 Transcript_11713/m.41826 type:complete len:252 (-) Transcript_11713:1607-2362(-)